MVAMHPPRISPGTGAADDRPGRRAAVLGIVCFDETSGTYGTCSSVDAGQGS